MEKQKTGIVLIEDHKIISDGLRLAFSNHPNYRIIATASSGAEALRILDFKSPELIILDLNLPDTNGLEILKALREKGNASKIIVLTMYNKASLIEEVKKCGGNGYLLKNSSLDELETAFDAVLDSSDFYTGKGTKHLISPPKTDEDEFLKKLKLTRREKEIIQQVVKGQNVPQIAEALNISGFTVETHKKNIFKKLNVHTSIDLINFINQNEISL